MIRRFLPVILLIACAAGGAAFVQAQEVCGCAFVDKEQPVNVSVRPDGARKEVPAKPNMRIRSGDLLKVQKEPRGTLVCDGVKGNVPLKNPPLLQPVPCQVKKDDIFRIGPGRVVEGATMNDAADSSIPIVLSPRRTRLLGAHPTLRWRSVRGATRYRVIIRGPEGRVWSTTVNATPGAEAQEIIYPSSPDTPPLQPGVTYKLIVEANDRSSDEEDEPGLGFTLLTADQALKVREAEAEIDKLKLAETTRRFLVASMYTNADLNYEAIMLLEACPETFNDPESLRLLGELYLYIGLIRKAEATYLKLFEPKLKEKDTDLGQATASRMLGQIYEALGSRAAAVQSFSEAKRLYQTLEDEKATLQINERLKILQQR
jgi:hypothetical protein